MNWDNWYDLIHIYYPFVSEYKRINDIPLLCNDLDKIVAVQNEMSIDIELWDYLITFEWTLDWIAVCNDWYYIVDIKTSASSWSDEDLKNKYQCVFYTALWCLWQWITEWVMRFEYWVFIKNKEKWRMQRLRRDIDISHSIKELKKYLLAYAEKWKLLSAEEK